MRSRDLESAENSRLEVYRKTRYIRYGRTESLRCTSEFGAGSEPGSTILKIN